MATQSLMRRLPPVSVMIAGLVLAIMLVLVVFAPLIAPMDPRDVSSYSLIDMEIPPAFMDGGELIESRPAAAFFAQPEHPRTRAFLESML